jgi:hypothetical protein
MDLTARQRHDIGLHVDEGAEHLDQFRPNWRVDLRQSIDMDRPLDMNDCRECVLGKLEGDYYVAMSKLFPELSGPEQEEMAIACGFTLPSYLLASPDRFLRRFAWRYLEECWLTKMMEGV